jgi:hypothetical protein
MSIFPDIDFEINEMAAAVAKEALPKMGKVFLFDFATKKHVLSDGKLVEADELQAIKQWVNLCLRTYINRYKIYMDTGFGVNAEDIIGHKTNLNDFYIIELEREIKDALLKNARIVGITEVIFAQNENVLNVSFTIELYNGEIVKQEVML